MLTLAIETSCDETSVAIIDDQRPLSQRILVNLITSQVDEHLLYGGVVPEIAARAHLHYLSPMVQQALNQANLSLKDIDDFAVTCGPGLLGGVLVGVMYSRALAAALQKPLWGVNHLAGHALSVRLEHDVEFPYLLLLVSGGHCQFIVVHSATQYTILGQTLDDAVGEAFDKTAKLMGLNYPGGPAIEALAQHGNPLAYKLPLPMIHEQGCDLSFSGLKNAVRLLCQKENLTHDSIKADIAASFQHAVNKTLKARALNAIKMAPNSCRTFAVAGGVAANRVLRQTLQEVASNHQMDFVCPSLKLCTDNAAMIGWAAIEQRHAGVTADGMEVAPKPRWPLDQLSHAH